MTIDKNKLEKNREKEWERERRKERYESWWEEEYEHMKWGTQEGNGVALLTTLLIVSTTAFLQELFLALSHLYSPLPRVTEKWDEPH